MPAVATAYHVCICCVHWFPAGYVLCRSLLFLCAPVVATPSPGLTKQQVLKHCVLEGAGIIPRSESVLNVARLVLLSSDHCPFLQLGLRPGGLIRAYVLANSRLLLLPLLLLLLLSHVFRFGGRFLLCFGFKAVSVRFQCHLFRFQCRACKGALGRIRSKASHLDFLLGHVCADGASIVHSIGVVWGRSQY